MPEKNIGNADRLFRLVLAIILLALAGYYYSWILLAISLFTFYEALASWCIFYQLIGKNTCPISRR
ncbi:MAG: DUF2892 domain-containing protein [Parachlamydia sp.]|nr:DUF2892 domain-containing protein [Parachlamydia sp.]